MLRKYMNNTWNAHLQNYNRNCWSYMLIMIIILFNVIRKEYNFSTFILLAFIISNKTNTKYVTIMVL